MPVKAPKSPSVRIKPEKKEPWEFIDEELSMIHDNRPLEDECDTPFVEQVAHLVTILDILRKDGAPAPQGIYPFDGSFIQIEWVLKKTVQIDAETTEEVEYQRVYADLEDGVHIDVTYTYPDREPEYKQVKNPKKILPEDLE